MPTIKLLSITTLILFLVISCSQKANVLSLTYKIDVEIASDTLDPVITNYLQQKFGDSVVMLLDNKGNVRYDFHNTGNYGYDYNLFNSSTNNYYSKWKSIDTVYYFNANSNVLENVNTQKLDNRIINGVDCETLTIKSIQKNNPDAFANITYYYSQDSLKVNPELYKGYKDFFFYDYLKLTNHIYLKKIVKMNNYNLTYTLIRKSNHDVDYNKFSEPKNLPLELQ